MCLEKVEVVPVGVDLVGTMLGRELTAAGGTVVPLERGRFQAQRPPGQFRHGLAHKLRHRGALGADRKAPPQVAQFAAVAEAMGFISYPARRARGRTMTATGTSR